MKDQHTNENIVENAVDHLLSQDKEYNELRNKYIFNNQSGGSYNQYTESAKQITNEDVNSIGKALSQNTSNNFKKIEKFTNAMVKKYANRKMDIGDVIGHARKHANKIKLSDTDFRSFEILYQNKVNKNSNNNRNSLISDALGVIEPGYVSNKSKRNISGADKQHVDEIIRIASLNKQDHARCVLQTNQYTIHGFHDILLNSRFHHGLQNRSCAVHPLLVALFGPKIPVLDERMLHSNLARMVVDRLQGKPINNRSDFEFFMDLTTDQQESVCDSNSIYGDLYKRIMVQELLRQAVWQMRGGQLYECNTSGIIAALDECQLTPSDSPHLLYIRDEGTMLRRLLSAFSFKPTHVTTRPVFTMNNYALTGVVPPVSQIDALSMINVNIPHKNTPLDNASNFFTPDITLEMGFNQSHFFLENGIVVPKQNKIVYSREVLFFYVNRRHQAISHNYHQAFSFGRLPVAVSGFDVINDREVTVKPHILISQQPYILRSVVCVNPGSLPNSVKTYNGCFTLLINLKDDENFRGYSRDHIDRFTEKGMKDLSEKTLEVLNRTKKFQKYDPYNQLTKDKNDEKDKSFNDANLNQVGDETIKEIQEFGTIYVYSQPMKDVRNQIPFRQLGIDFHAKSTNS